MPTQSFFTAEQRIPISQKKVSVRAENGLSYQLGQQINFVIPAGVGYMMPQESYLRLDVKVKLPSDSASGTVTRLCLDQEIGANVLIRDVRISSGGAQNVLLEEIQNANILTALKYDYETNETLKSKRALTEGAVDFNPGARRTFGSEETAGCNHQDNPYFSPTAAGSDGNGSDQFLTDDDFQTVKCLIKIPGGIFNNDKVFPLQLTEGLRIELLLEEQTNVFRQLTNVVRDNSIQSNPRFHSLNGSWTAPDVWGTNNACGNQSVFYVNNVNNYATVDQIPFVIGETIAFYNPTTGVEIVPLRASDSAAVGCRVQGLDFVSASGGVPIQDGAGLVAVTVESCSLTGLSASITPDFAIFSYTPERATNYEPTCSIDNVELLVQQVEMPEGYTSKMMSMLKSGGAMNYDFTSFTNYKYSQLASDRQVNIRLPIQNSRCKSVLAIPVDASVYTTKDAMRGKGTYTINNVLADCGANGSNNSLRSGLTGICDRASNYQFIYDGKLNPSRKVPVSRIANIDNQFQGIDQQWLIESEKALYMAGIEPLSFLNYQKNWFIGRALSLQNGVYDARGKDFNLQVEYTETSGQPTKPHLWNCFVSHLRRIVVRGDSISIEV
tara:strand:+ start:5409 stop:7241 length:1833 start_codon:yes stop_codon:yes gene_type:complete